MKCGAALPDVGKPPGHVADPHPRNKLSGRLIGGIVVVATAVILGRFFGPSQSQPTSLDSPTSTSAPHAVVPSAAPPTLEYKLAVINNNGYVREDDITVARFRYLLESLSEKTTNSKQQIADITAMASEDARKKYGKKLSVLDLMEAANTFATGLNGRKISYAFVMASVIVVLTQ